MAEGNDDAYPVTDRTQLHRRPDRGRYDRAVVHKIIDEALICHVGVSIDGVPHVLPSAIVRVGEAVYLHGGTNNHLLTALAGGAPACITVTLIDSLVAGRSGFGCSMDYRSVVIFATAETVSDPDEKAAIIAATVQDIIPGHVVRPPKPKELAATLVLRFPLLEVSAKVRDVGVLDVEEDYAGDLWAGVIPLRLAAEPAIPCPRLKQDIATPAYAAAYKR